MQKLLIVFEIAIVAATVGATDYKISLGGVQKMDAPGGKIQFVTAPDSYTKLLLHCDGANTSTNFIDSSASNHAVTAVGTAQLDTSQKKFGSASLLLDGNSDYASIVDNIDWQFHNADFTVDFWAKLASTNASCSFFSQASDGNHESKCAWRLSDKQLTFSWYWIDAYKANFACGWLPSTNVWYHIAVGRSGTNGLIFINGISQSIIYSTGLGDAMNDIAAPFLVGYFFGYGYMNGRMEEFRVSKGIARWTNNFTLPARSYNE